MPAGPRIRGNNSYGITTDNPLTIGATTFNSPGLATLPVVSSAHAVITLDPLRQFGEPEIVVVTAHTASATVATITRGQYGTVARSHPQNTTWVHAPITEDVIEVLTSGTRPGNPYEGQLIYETDTDYYMGYSGSAWEYGWKLGAWTAWSPVISQSNTPAQTVNWARYTRVGRLITAHFRIALSGAGTINNNIVLSGLPVVAPDPFAIGGSFRYFDTGNTNRAGTITGATTTTTTFVYDGYGNSMGNGDFVIANGDSIQGTLIMEAAS